MRNTLRELRNTLIREAIQVSEKLYKVVKECMKALAETLNTPEAQEARRNGRWFTWLLGSTARSVANRLGRPEIVEAWALAYDIHVGVSMRLSIMWMMMRGAGVHRETT